MPILSIRHVTTYHYRQPVAFGEHRMMLRPRDDNDQRELEFEINITPRPSRLSSSRDSFGNHVAVARFAERASELRFESSFRVDHAPGAFRAADIEDLTRIHRVQLYRGRSGRPRALPAAVVPPPQARRLGRRVPAQ